MSLFPYAMALALSFGATRVIGAVSHSVARLYRRFGLDLRDIGIDTAAPISLRAQSIWTLPRSTNSSAILSRC